MSIASIVLFVGIGIAVAVIALYLITVAWIADDSGQLKARAINLTGQNFLELHDEKGRHDVYAMMVLGFSQPLVSGFYIVAMALLCLHLSHGVYSMFQSVGWTFGGAPEFPKRLAKWEFAKMPHA